VNVPAISVKPAATATNLVHPLFAVRTGTHAKFLHGKINSGGGLQVCRKYPIKGLIRASQRMHLTGPPLPRQKVGRQAEPAEILTSRPAARQLVGAPHV
jgi:hypothetical protein